ncbi:MAG: nitroreductase family protein [Candidatus Dormibacteraeota bacterium]|nr:nitroreductase family protein [Candidatus Dormibacteraeota bacterium]
MTADEVLTTTRSVRRRLDLTRPVPRQLLVECLEVAVQAPTGGNRQGWHFVLVSDPDRKAAISDHYRRSFAAYRRGPQPSYEASDIRAQRAELVHSSADYLAEHMHEAPWLVIPLIQGRLRPDAPASAQAAHWGSILPAFWSFQLAARARGLGTAWTTLHLAYEREVAEILGIPYERFTQAGLSPVAFFTGDGFRPAPRIPLEGITHWEQW